MSWPETWVKCTAVNRSESAPASASTAVGRRPWAAMHASFSAGCSETCACSGQSRRSAHPATIAADSGSTARTLWIAAPALAPGPRSPRSSTRSAQAAALPSPKRSWSGSSGVPNPPCR